MLPQHRHHLQQSKTALLAALGDDHDLVLVRVEGDIRAELSRAGAKQLLGGHFHREVTIDELPAASGATALICGTSPDSGLRHDLMPHVLAVAELRFERVILLPSSFDMRIDALREALERSRAIVFARERESYGQIQPLCDARLAHDTSFFFDYSSYQRPGTGVLCARSGGEQADGEHMASSGDNDVSLKAGSLEGWLGTIADHAEIRTDRADVMIAGSLLGKTVGILATDNFDVSAIAEYALSGYPVEALSATTPREQHLRLEPSRTSPEGHIVRDRLRLRAEAEPPPRLVDTADVTAPRVTAVVISHNRRERVLGALHSLIYTTTTPLRVVVVDNNSSEADTRELLGAVCAEHPQVRLHLSDRNLGAAGGRKLALDLLDTELVLFLDDDAELLPGALEHMISELDRDPDAAAVSATVVLPDGRVSHSGGSRTDSPQIVSFTLDGSGLPYDSATLPPSGPCDWVAWTVLLVRRRIFDVAPLDPAMFAYFEDNDWCLRVARTNPHAFRRSREALAIHHASDRPWAGEDFATRAHLVRFIAAAAQFYRLHGVLLGVPGTDIFTIMPELTRTNGTLDLAGARLVMELASTHSAGWLLMEWMNGGLDPVLGVERTALGDALHASQLEANALRAELAEARSASSASVTDSQRSAAPSD